MVGNTLLMPYSSETKLNIIKEVLENNERVTDIAKKYSVSRKSIYSWIKRYENAPNKKKPYSLETRYKKGVEHHNSYKHELRSDLVRLISKNPEWGVNLLSKKLRVGRHAVYNLLRQMDLRKVNDRVVFANLYSGPGRLDEDIKISIVKTYLEGEESITGLSKKYSISRKSIYSWIKRYEKEGSVKEKYVEGFEHPMSFSKSDIGLILGLVIKSPELSIRKLAKILPYSTHGVYRILVKYNLTDKYSRINYAKAQRSEFSYQHRSQVYGEERTVQEKFVPTRAPAPPPSRIFSFIKTSVFSLFVFSIIFLTSFYWIELLSNATSAPNFIGIFFATIALIMGGIFFLYSLKYYFTLAVVLSYSQQKGQHDISDGSIKASGFLGWLLGNADGNGTKDRIESPGLQPDLKHVNLVKHPFISIQIPFYNERNVVERAMAAATNFEYEGGYEVMLCDDSTDETTQIIRNYQRKYLVEGEELNIIEGEGWNLSIVEVKKGVFLKHLHRTSRSGFKGGALGLALKFVDPRTEFISIFDADFVPYPDTLNLFLKYFKVQNNMSEEYRKSDVAAVQGYQWHVLNKSENWITRGVRSEYAGSYVIERAGTEVYGGLKQISGSVYMIRKDVLEEVGWETSITEDFELTLKLYNAGYKVVYTPYIQAPAECVSTLRRLIRQRMRWAEGHSFNVKKMWKKLLLNPKLTVAEKFEFTYLMPYYLQAFFFIVGSLSWLMAETIFPARLPFWTSLWGWSLVLTNMISLPLMNAVGIFLEEGEAKDYSGLMSYVALSYILVPFQAYASFKGFFEKEEGGWFRTPKTGRITDVLRRGSFYRFITGIFPGKIAREPMNEKIGRISGQYLALTTANNQFNSFKIKPKKARWAGKIALSLLLVISVSLYSLSRGVPEVFATSDVLYFNNDTVDSYGYNLTNLYSSGGGETWESFMGDPDGDTYSAARNMNDAGKHWYYSDPTDQLTVNSDTWTLNWVGFTWAGSGPPPQQYMDWAFSFGYCDNADGTGDSCSSATDYHQLGASATIQYTSSTSGDQSHNVTGSTVSTNPCSATNVCRIYFEAHVIAVNHIQTYFTYTISNTGYSNLNPPVSLTVPENVVYLAVLSPIIPMLAMWLKRRNEAFKR